MKPTHMIPPAIALIAMSFWIVPQRRSLAILERECGALKSRITAAEARSSPQSAQGEARETPRTANEWARLATLFQSNPMPWDSLTGYMTGAIPDTREATRFAQQMKAMSTEEIIAALDEIASLNLPTKIRENLEWTLIDSMAKKDPVAALGLMESRGMMKSSLYEDLISMTVQLWAHKDTAAAAEWFDQQITAGTFDSKSINSEYSYRLHLESTFIKILLASSLEAATRRLTALPDYQRGNLLHYWGMSRIPEEIQAAHAALVRAQVPIKEQAETIASQLTNLVKHGDYSAATAYLDRISATPAERAASAMMATRDMFPINSNSGKLSREDFDALREWVGIQSPESVDQVTLKALATAAPGDYKITFAAAVDLAIEYSAQSGNDEILAGFLSSEAARRNKTSARDHAAKIADDTRRAEVLDSLK